MEAYEPPGVRFYDAASQREMLLVKEPGHPNDGWLCYRHPDGQWVTVRKATVDDLSRISSAAAPPSSASPRATPTGEAEGLVECETWGLLNEGASRDAERQKAALSAARAALLSYIARIEGERDAALARAEALEGALAEARRGVLAEAARFFDSSARMAAKKADRENAVAVADVLRSMIDPPCTKAPDRCPHCGFGPVEPYVGAPIYGADFVCDHCSRLVRAPPPPRSRGASPAPATTTNHKEE